MPSAGGVALVVSPVLEGAGEATSFDADSWPADPGPNVLLGSTHPVSRPPTEKTVSNEPAILRKRLSLDSLDALNILESYWMTGSLWPYSPRRGKVGLDAKLLTP